MPKLFADIVPVFFDKEAALSDGRGELPGHGQTISDMCDACVDDPVGLIELLEGCNEAQVEMLFPFFEELLRLPDGERWILKASEAVSGKASREVLAELAKLI